MKKLELRDLENRVSAAALEAYNDSDLDIFENEDGTLTVRANRDTVATGWTFETLDQFLTGGND